MRRVRDDEAFVAFFLAPRDGCLRLPVLVELTGAVDDEACDDGVGNVACSPNHGISVPVHYGK